MNKTTALGAFIGIFTGLLLYFYLPRLLNTEFEFLQLTKTSQGYSAGQFNVLTGSAYAVGWLFPVLTGLFGGLVGYFISKRKQN